MNKQNNLGEVARLFFKLGCIGFGGPAVHIALMEEEVVRRKKWMSPQHFLDLVGATNLIPGPNSTEMTMHIGYERSGWKGLVVAGCCFIFPAVIITAVFAWLYQQYGQLPQVQLFIYGDKDGIGVFPGLISMFSNANWKIDGSNKQWVTVTSAKGRPVSLYMNRPLPEENGEDAKAQEALCGYLVQNKIVPTVTINRGHSYNAPYTIEQMSTASKIVFMGSCGGYRMIHDILQKAPDAHIIGTKQIADAPVNNPFLKLIMEKLRTGSNIEWIPFWHELDGMVTDKIFEDYVPPHKNLGALFIKAYRMAMEEKESE